MRAQSMIVAIVVLACVAYPQRHKPHQRIYSNDVPPLQIIGVAMSENMDNAHGAIEVRGRGESKLQMQFPIMLDAPSALRGGEGGQVPQTEMRDAWDVRGGGQFACDSRIAKMFRLEKYGPMSLVLLDRHMRIRAIAASLPVIGNASENRIAELIEYLLLNVGGVEAVPYDVAGMSDGELAQALDPHNAGGLYSWEHAAELQRREAARGVSAAEQTVVYPLLGQQAPDFELPLANGTGTVSFSSLARDKVTLLVLFWAGGAKSDFTARGQTTTALEYMKVIDKLHVDWTLKLAQPGDREHPNAQPFTGTSTDIVKASVHGEAGGASPIAKAVGAASNDEGAEAGQEAGETLEKRWGLSLALGVRYYSWEKFAEDSILKPLYQVNPLAGLKLRLHIVSFVSAEASLLPSFILGSFAENDKHYNEKLQLFIPLSINVVVQPPLGDGFFSPFVTLGIGPGLAVTKIRIANDPLPPDPDWINTATDEYVCPSGFGIQVNPGIGGEFRINSKMYTGLDIRYFFMTIQPVSSEKEIDIELNTSNEFAERIVYNKPFKYDNASIFAYAGMRF